MKTACRMLGYRHEKLLSMTISDIRPNDVAAIRAVGESVLVQGSGRIEECQCRTCDGQDIDCELSASVIDVAGKRCMLALVRNITERKRAEQSLRSVAEGTSSVVGSDFLASLVRNLAQSLGCDTHLSWNMAKRRSELRMSWRHGWASSMVNSWSMT